MLQIVIEGRAEDVIRELAEKCRLPPTNYARQIIESWLVDHRSNTVKRDPTEYDNRNADPNLEGGL